MASASVSRTRLSRMRSRPLCSPPAETPATRISRGRIVKGRIVALIVASLCTSSGARAAPQGFQVYGDPQGTGRVLFGTFSGNSRSATIVLRGILEKVRGYFDDVPEIRSGVRDDADQHVQAMFFATIQRAPVLGVAAIDLANGGGSASLLFDHPETIQASFPRLRAVLAANAPQRRPEVPLQRTLADGSTIGVPPGWRVTNVGKGSVDMRGPRGEAISLGAAAPVYTRVQRLPGMPHNYVLQAPCCDPARAYIALFPQIALALQQRFGAPPQQLRRIVEVQPTS